MNLLGIDFEDWYHPELIKPYISGKDKNPTVINGIDKILELLRKNEVNNLIQTLKDYLKWNY